MSMRIFDNHRLQAAFLKIASLWPATYDAPYVAAPMPVICQMLELAEVGPEDLVYDLGCGDGRTVITAAKEYGARTVGIELDTLRYFWCQMLITLLGLRGHVKIILGNFFNEDLSKADVVTCYIGQDANKKIQEKFKKELRPNTRIVSYNFIFPELNLIKKDDETGLYLYNLQN
jgi:predicted RNA methylase